MKLAAITLIWIFGVTVYAGDKLYLESGVKDLSSLQPKNLNSVLRSVGRKTAPTSYYVLQFKNGIKAADQKALSDNGIQVLRYIPDDAYVVHASFAQLQVLQSKNSNIVGFAPYNPDLRVSSALKIRSVFNATLPQTVRVQTFKNVNIEALADTLESKGYVIGEISEDNLLVTLPTQELDQLASQEGVEWITQPAHMQLHNFDIASDESGNDDSPLTGDFTDLSGYETGTKVMNFDQAWDAGFHGEQQIVGISDTGLDTGDKKTLAADFEHLKNAFALGYATKSWADPMGHGTHVSGSVLGAGELSKGYIKGGANKAQLIMQSMWSDSYKNLTVPADLKVLYTQSYQNGARIHSNSWGDPKEKGVYDAESSQVDQFLWEHPDMVILFAAGNDGIDADKDGRVDAGSISSPATAKNVISVGASENLVHRGGIQRKVGDIELPKVGKPWPTEPLASDTFSNNINGLVAFSSRGPTVDGRLKPDVVAPGSNILSNCSHTKGSEELWGRYNPDYCFCGGTSMSTPLTAGAAAVIRQRLQKVDGLGSPSGALIKAVMMHTAVDMYPGQFGEVGEAQGQEILKHAPNADEGYGRVDVGTAVTAKLSVVDEKTGVGDGETLTYKAMSGVRKITLVYTDYPAGPESLKALVNNLDLLVQVGDQTFSSESTVDNTEQVVLDGSAQGDVQIIVRGTKVPMGNNGKQPYALVYSGSN